MGLLSNDHVQSIHSASVACGLASQLDALVSGLPAPYIAQLPASGAPGARLLQVLHALNDVSALADGTVPLRHWLRNASTLTSGRIEGRVFETALQELDRIGSPALVPTPIGAPRMPVSSLDRPARIFISYAHADEALRKRLDVHLSPLRRQGLIAPWHDRMIEPGKEWAGEIDENLTEADIVLLLLSADFVASDYCYETELQLALDRHRRGEARVIPIVIKPVDFRDAPFAKLQALPRDAKPVTAWSDQDEAWLDVVKGIRRVVESLGAKAANAPSGGSR